MIPHRHKQEENVDSWLMSYADMITLLMCFFIIFVSVSEPKKDKFSSITQGIASQFGAVDLATPFQGAYLGIQGVIESKQLLRDVAIVKTERSIEMELSSGSFFKKDSVEFNPEKMEALSEMVMALKNIDFINYRIIVEGHTNDVKVNPQLYPSNWEYSAALASRIVRLLIENGIKPERLSAVGYGGTRPKVSNIDLNGEPIIANREKNQRIVITLERTL